MAKLSKTKQRIFNKRIFGFDIETYDNNKEFLCASIYGEEYKKMFYSKEKFIEEIKTNYIFRNSVLFATNLSFDFFGTFFSGDEKNNFFTLFRGSDLLMAETHFYKGEFFPFAQAPTKSKKTLKSLRFLDSLNFAKLSVAKMGKIIGIPKLESPSFIGKYPQDKEEWKIMEEYNFRDSEVTFKFMKFLIAGMEGLGATFKNTLASTAMSLFKNKYLDKDYYQPSEDILLEIFESYYGGRTEAFKRGYIKDYNYYDFNSLYPSVMEAEEFPDPNSLRTTRYNKPDYIMKFHGTSNVVMECPADLKFPVLPVRLASGKVIFPTGKISGWYTHIEIREAMANGYVLMKIIKTHYFTKNCRPFQGFVRDLYSLRKEYKAENNPMEYLVKILMNSLYGKFGQKFINKENVVHESAIKPSELDKYDKFEPIGTSGFYKITDSSKPSAFCIPIWASYVSAYGRVKLHRAIVQSNPVYCDTDSLITKETLPTSLELGDLKLEMKVKEGYIVRPKFYAVVEDDNNSYVKIKGLGKRLSYFEFGEMLAAPLQENGHTQKICHNKFTKFKESIRRGLIPNEIIAVNKEFSLEDEKRIWPTKFDMNVLQDSLPLVMETI
jgi:hypothetical protein